MVYFVHLQSQSMRIQRESVQAQGKHAAPHRKTLPDQGNLNPGLSGRRSEPPRF